MLRRDREGGCWVVEPGLGKRREGRLSLSWNWMRGWVCWLVVVMRLCVLDRPADWTVYSLSTFVCGGGREILSTYLDCDCAFGLCAHDSSSDGWSFVRGRGRYVCDVAAIVIANRDFSTVFFDVSDCCYGCARRRLSSLLQIVSCDLCSYAVCLICSHHPSRARSASLAQITLPSTVPLALRLFAVSLNPHRHDSGCLPCFFWYYFPDL